MALKATCRCGHELTVLDDKAERVVCPSCGARVRLKRVGPVDDGFIRFTCPCGRRLKVPSNEPPSHGKCPECGRIVPVPLTGLAGAESRTEELRTEESARLEQWADEHRLKGSRIPREVGPAAARAAAAATPSVPAPSLVASPVASNSSEAGLRVCPQCGRPIHLGAESCRKCGIVVPRK